MTPTVVKFTGLDFDPLILSKEYGGPAPTTWVRHQFKLESHYVDSLWDFKEWMFNNMSGRWTVQSATIMGGTVFLVAFEKDTDAVMFRLMDGETAWQEDEDDLH